MCVYIYMCISWLEGHQYGGLFFQFHFSVLKHRNDLFVHNKVVGTVKVLDTMGKIWEQILTDTCIYVKSKAPKLQTITLKRHCFLLEKDIFQKIYNDIVWISCCSNKSLTAGRAELYAWLLALHTSHTTLSSDSVSLMSHFRKESPRILQGSLFF